MIRASLAPILAATLLATPFAAAAQDARIVERFYDEGKIVRIEGKTKVQATIQFAEDERIENVAIGDSEAWQVTPNKRANLLFVKPLAPNAQTNMTVVTDRRTYLFDLVASASSRPLYVLRFTYPDEPKAELAASDAPTADDAVLVKVGASRRTQAVIGKAGEEDLFTFEVTRGRRHTIDTRGDTDVVMKLFGPDSRTDLIAEDDDSGVGTNARLNVDLVAGTYVVQVRHYDRRRGKGDYTLGVRRA